MENKRLVLWDWNGCLLDDCEWVYRLGPARIFRHFGMPVPPLDVYRNEVESNFMSSFYWKYGIPRTVTAKDLDAIMKGGYEEHGEPPLHADALATLQEVRDLGLTQVLVTGFDATMLHASLRHHGIEDFFAETHGNARAKTEIFTKIMARLGMEEDECIGVTDTLGDVASLEAAGVRPFICPRGFHGRERIEAACGTYPRMTVIEDFASFTRHLY